MRNDEVDKLLEQAKVMLEVAERETERSHEDVVTHLLCANSRQSLLNYLSVFLMKRNVPLNEPVTLDGLHRQCKEIDARFDVMDLSAIHCRFESHDRDYCLNLVQVNQCMDAARLARSIVTHDVPGY